MRLTLFAIIGFIVGAAFNLGIIHLGGIIPLTSPEFPWKTVLPFTLVSGALYAAVTVASIALWRARKRPNRNSQPHTDTP